MQTFAGSCSLQFFFFFSLYLSLPLGSHIHTWWHVDNIFPILLLYYFFPPAIFFIFHFLVSKLGNLVCPTAFFHHLRTSSRRITGGGNWELGGSSKFLIEIQRPVCSLKDVTKTRFTSLLLFGSRRA
jgi:hypothetical protein